MMKALLPVLVGVTLAFASAAGGADETDKDVLKLSIERKSVRDALNDWAQQTGYQLVAEIKGEFVAPQIKGRLTAQEALERLLEGTPLTYEWMGERLVAVRETRVIPAAMHATGSDARPQKLRVAQLSADEGLGGRELKSEAAPASQTSNPELSREPDSRGMPEVLVVGSRILNTDIARSRDDAQPYVIFDRTVIDQSGATNVDEFLRQRLTMNSTSLTGSQQGNVTGSRSEINLRGLGANQTLILVDGRRIAGVSAGGTPAQPDVNGIPLAAIERIEVLPSTASGIYGGSATGGVINIVLRRNYDGAEVNLNYESTFSGGSSLRRVDASKGFNFNGGSTNLLFAATYSEQDSLPFVERRFQRRGVQRILGNNPSFFLSGSAPPPLGSTTNISSIDGSDLLFDDGTQLNSPITFVPAGYSGTASDAGAALAANAGRFNLDLARSAQFGMGGERSLLAEPTLKALQGTLRHEFGARVSAFLDLAGSENTSEFTTSGLDFGAAIPGVTIDADAPNNPFQQTIQVAVPAGVGDGIYEVKTESRRAAGGVIVDLSNEWVLGLDYTWNRGSIQQDQPRSSFDGFFAIGDGSLDVLRDPALYESDFLPLLRRYRTSPFESTTTDANLRVSGPIWSLPAGNVTLSALLERREDAFGNGEGREFLDSGPGTPLVETDRLLEKTQNVNSVYVELRVPIVSKGNGVPGIRSLELQAAGRNDSYETNWAQARVSAGSTDPIRRGKSELDSTDPTVGLRYEISQDVALRASYGTGFLPPSVADFSMIGPFDFGDLVVDPLRGNELAFVTATFGGNPNLKPEESESWSLGLVLTPRFLPQFRFSLDYTRIGKTENIRQLTGQQIVDNEGFLVGRVVRAEPDPGDPFGVGPIISVDETAINIARAKVEAFDIALDYAYETQRFGTFDFSALGTRQTHLETQLLPTAPLVEEIGVTSNNPLKFKANATLSWRYNDWTVGWTTKYFHSYVVSLNPTVVANQGSRHVPSQTYHDLFASYHTGIDMFGMSNLDIQAGIKNVFDEEPPFDAGAGGTGYYSPIGDPRLSSYYLAVKLSF